MMGTRRWVGALEAWLSNTDWTKDKLAERSQHSAAHVREMFERADPNPTLRLYLELVQLSGARFQGVTTNEPVEVIKRIKEILVRENIATVSALAKVAQINRSQLSTLFNDPDPNPTLATFDRLVVALGAEQEFHPRFVHRQRGRPGDRRGRGGGPGRETGPPRSGTFMPSPNPRRSSQRCGASSVKRKRTRAAAERDAAAATMRAELRERIAELHEMNVALEKRRADDAAQILRLRGTNAALEELRAEDAAELELLRAANGELERLHAEDALTIARLHEEQARLREQMLLFGVGCLMTGAGIAAAVLTGRRKR
jgi:DNA-binding phage protein